MEKAKEFQKNIYFCSLNMRKPLTMWITTSLKILKEIGLPNHFTCLLRNLYAGQEATVRTRHGTTDWFSIGKRVQITCILSPCWQFQSERCVILFFTWTHRGHCRVINWPNYSNVVSQRIREAREKGWGTNPSMEQSEYTHLSIVCHLTWAQFMVPQNNYNSNIKGHWSQITTQI